MSDIDGSKPQTAVSPFYAVGNPDKSKNSPTNKTPRISTYRDPNKEVSNLLDDNPNKNRIDLRKSLRSARNSNDSDITRPRSAHPTPPRERSTRPSFEGKSRDELRSTRSFFESESRRSTTSREGLRSARSSFESDSRRSTRKPNVAAAFVNSIHAYFSNDELHLREYVEAVVNGDLENVQRGIELCTIDPNYCGTDGFNALFAASWEGHLHVVNYLLSKGANVNVVVPSTKYSPTHAAATDGYVDVLKALLDAGTNIPTMNVCVNAPLSSSSLKYLFHSPKGADVNSINTTGLTPLIVATRSGQIDAVHLLVSRDANVDLVDHLGMTALHAACSDGHFEIAKFLLEHGARVNALNSNHETPFFLCAASACWIEEGHLACLQLLRENGANVDTTNAFGKTPEAVAGDHLKPYFRLCQLQPSDPECLSLLKDDEYHLWFALIAANFKSSFVRNLVQLYPCLEDCTDSHGRIAHDAASPLMKGAFFRTPMESFKSFTSSRSGASVRYSSRHSSLRDPTVAGFTNHWMSMSPMEKKIELLTLAREGELTESLLVMMLESVDLNCVDAYGWTPLYEAIHQGHLDVVKLLVAEGADVDHVDLSGWSPLYLAAYYGHLEIVKFLAVQGSDVKQTDKQGKRPIDVAQSADIRDFLKNAANEIRKLKQNDLIMRKVESLSSYTARRESQAGGATSAFYSNGRRRSRSLTSLAAVKEDSVKETNSSSVAKASVRINDIFSDVEIAAAFANDDDDDHNHHHETYESSRGRPRERREYIKRAQLRNTEGGIASREGSCDLQSGTDDNQLVHFGVNPSQLHICISYCRHTKAKPELAAALTWQLREVHGYDVWFDKDGSSLCTKTPCTDSDKQDNDPLTLSDHMKDVIARSHAVIVCMSREYKNNQSDHKVAKYAKQRRNPSNGRPLRVHYVLMQQDYTTLSELCHPLFSQDDVSTTAERLAALIGDTGKIVKPIEKVAGTSGANDSTSERLFVPSTKSTYKLVDSLDLESQKFKSVVEFSEKLRALGVGDVAGSEGIDQQRRRSSTNLRLNLPDYNTTNHYHNSSPGSKPTSTRSRPSLTSRSFTEGDGHDLDSLSSIIKSSLSKATSSFLLTFADTNDHHSSNNNSSHENNNQRLVSLSSASSSL